MVDQIIQKGFGYALMSYLRKKLREVTWGKFKQLEQARLQGLEIP